MKNQNKYKHNPSNKGNLSTAAGDFITLGSSAISSKEIFQDELEVQDVSRLRSAGNYGLNIDEIIPDIHIDNKIHEEQNADILLNEFFETMILAVDKDGHFKGCATLKEAEDIFALSRKSLENYLKKGKIIPKGYVLVYGKNVSSKNFSGRYFIDRTKLAVATNNGFKDIICAIDLKGNIFEFESRMKVKNKINVSPENIKVNLSGQTKTAGGYIITTRKKISSPDSIGFMRPDREKVFNLMKSVFWETAVCAIDYKGEVFEQYKSGIDAANNLELDTASVYSCLSGDLRTSGGFIFVKRKEIADITPDFKILINPEKIFETRRKRFQDKMVCVIKQNGEYDIYNTQSDVAQNLNINPKDVSRCVAGKTKIVGGVTVVPIEKLLSTDENGREIINSRLAAQVYAGAFGEYLCLIDIASAEVVKEYKTRAEASRDLCIAPTSIKTKKEIAFEGIKGHILVAKKNILTCGCAPDIEKIYSVIAKAGL